MNYRNDNLIEKKLLSRCRSFKDDTEIVKTLEKRYSATGDQKNFLVLKPTGEQQQQTQGEAKKAQPSLLHQIKTFKTNDNKYNTSRTRNEFKLFIQKNLQLQKKTVNKLQRNKGLQAENLKEFPELLKFESFLGMNELWNEYIKSLLSGAAKPIKGGKQMPSISQADLQQILSKLSSADLIGSFITVKSSANTTLVGKSGIVIWESQHGFLIVVPRNDNWKNDLNVPKIDGKVFDSENDLQWSARDKVGGLRVILKKNSVFELSIPSLVEEGGSGSQGYKFDIVGNRFLIKSYERANKKFKNHNVDDIAL